MSCSTSDVSSTIRLSFVSISFYFIRMVLERLSLIVKRSFSMDSIIRNSVFRISVSFFVVDLWHSRTSRRQKNGPVDACLRIWSNTNEQRHILKVLEGPLHQGPHKIHATMTHIRCNILNSFQFPQKYFYI